MNKSMFSLVCATALLTALNAEDLDGNSQKIYHKGESLVINSETELENKSVADTNSQLDKNQKTTIDGIQEKATNLVIHHLGKLEVTGNGELKFKRDGDLVLKSGGKLDVKNKKSTFTFENVKMNEGVLDLKNSTLLTGNFNSENNSKIILSGSLKDAGIGDKINEHKIQASKDINLKNTDVYIRDYELKSQKLTMSNVSGKFNNALIESQNDMLIENSNANFNNKTELESKNKLTLNKYNGKVNNAKLNSTGDMIIEDSSGDFTNNSLLYSERNIKLNKYNGKIENSRLSAANNIEISNSSLNFDTANLESLNNGNVDFKSVNGNFKNSNIIANKISIKESATKSEHNTFKALSEGVYLENLKDGSSFDGDTFATKEINIKNSNADFNNVNFGDDAETDDMVQNLNIEGGKLNILESNINVQEKITISNLNGNLKDTGIVAKQEISLNNIQANISNSDFEVGDDKGKNGKLILDNVNFGEKNTLNSQDIVVKNSVNFSGKDEYSDKPNNRVKITTTNIKKADGQNANLTLENVNISSNEKAKFFENFSDSDTVTLKGENVVINNEETSLGEGLRFKSNQDSIFRKHGSGVLKANANTINSINHLRITDGVLEVTGGELKFENGKILSMDYQKGLLKSDSKVSINKEESSKNNKAKFNLLGAINDFNKRGETNPFIQAQGGIDGEFELMNAETDFFEYKLKNENGKLYAQVSKKTEKPKPKPPVNPDDNNPAPAPVPPVNPDNNNNNPKPQPPVVPPKPPVNPDDNNPAPVPPKESKIFQKNLSKMGYDALLDMGRTLDAATNKDKNGNFRSRSVTTALANTLGRPVAKEDLIYFQPLLSGQGTKIVSDISNNNKNLVLNRENKKDKNFWGIVSSNFDKKDTRKDGVLGYNGDHYTGIAGIDGNIDDSVNLGLAFAFTKSDIKGDLNHKLDINSYEMLLYSDIYATNELKFDVIAGLGKSKNKGERQIRIAKDRIKSRYDSKFYTFGLGVEYLTFENTNMKILPYLRADYTNITNDAYKESGDDKIALSVDKSKFDSLLIEAGVKSDFNLNENLKFNTKLGIAKEMLDKETLVNAEFLGFMNQKDSKFNIKSKTDNKALGVVGIGLSYDVSEFLNFGFGYNARFGKEYKNQSLLFGSEYRF